MSSSNAIPVGVWGKKVPCGTIPILAANDPSSAVSTLHCVGLICLKLQYLRRNFLCADFVKFCALNFF